MSSTVLARKYRPRSFAQMAGQDHVVRALTHALQTQRLHHAYLFTGTRGIGKTTISRILAKSLNCTGPDGQGGITVEPCGQCTTCREIDADRFVDYIELDAASNRSIDEVRDLIERAAYKPAVGRFKVFMIDEAHQLTKEAFNALLKTLEEPPEYLKFVLATTDPEKMLPTVLSRCLQFNLRPMAPEVVRDHLTQVLDAEGVAHDAGALNLLARAARGSMRDALSLTDQAIAFGSGRLEEEAVRSMLGVADDRLVGELLWALAQRDGAAVLRHAQALLEAGHTPGAALEQMARWLQLAAVAQVVPDAVAADQPESALTAQLAAHMAPDELQLLYSILLQGRAEMSLMSDAQAAFNMVLLRYLAFQAEAPAAPPRAAALRAPPPPALSVPVPASIRPTAPPVTLPATADPAPPPSPSPSPRPSAMPQAVEPPAPSTPATPARLDATCGDRWQACVRGLIDAGRISGLARELAWQGGLVACLPGDPPRWQLEVPHEPLRTPALIDKLTEALAESLGHPVILDVQQGPASDSPSRREAALKAQRQARAEEAIHNDPAVQDLLRQFQTARIVPGSIKPL